MKKNAVIWMKRKLKLTLSMKKFKKNLLNEKLFVFKIFI